MPDDWVQREDLGDEVRQRGGVAFLDPIGADIPALWEAHLIASCDTMRGVTTIEQLEAIRAGHLRQYDNAVVEVLTVGGTNVVRSEYDIETDGKVEHWYAYNLLAGHDWMCSITLVTPLKPTEREHIDAVFDAIAQRSRREAELATCPAGHVGRGIYDVKLRTDMPHRERPASRAL